MPMLSPYFAFFSVTYIIGHFVKSNESCCNRSNNKTPTKDQIFQIISTFLQLPWTIIILFDDIIDHNFTINLGRLTKTIIINLISKQTLIVFFVGNNIIM